MSLSSSRNRGVAETIHLSEKNVDETLTEASEGRVTLMKVNVDENHGLAVRYAIRSIPMIVFFNDGAVVERAVGAARRAVLRDIVNARA